MHVKRGGAMALFTVASSTSSESVQDLHMHIIIRPQDHKYDHVCHHNTY